MNSSNNLYALENPEIENAFFFRQALNAISTPGKIFDLSCNLNTPNGLSKSAGSLLLCLCDFDTPIFLSETFNTDEIRKWITFHTNSNFTEKGNCKFALGNWEELLPFEKYQLGTDAYPDRSATLIINYEKISNNGTKLFGPGIKNYTYFNLPDEKKFRNNNSLFPLGLDFFFSYENKFAAIPRSTRIGEK